MDIGPVLTAARDSGVAMLGLGTLLVVVGVTLAWRTIRIIKRLVQEMGGYGRW